MSPPPGTLPPRLFLLFPLPRTPPPPLPSLFLLPPTATRPRPSDPPLTTWAAAVGPRRCPRLANHRPADLFSLPYSLRHRECPCWVRWEIDQPTEKFWLPCLPLLLLFLLLCPLSSIPPRIDCKATWSRGNVKH